jgi:hypothetical protein
MVGLAIMSEELQNAIKLLDRADDRASYEGVCRLTNNDKTGSDDYFDAAEIIEGLRETLECLLDNENA